MPEGIKDADDIRHEPEFWSDHDIRRERTDRGQCIKAKAVELLSESEDLEEVRKNSFGYIVAVTIVDIAEDLKTKPEHSLQGHIDNVLRCAHDFQAAIHNLRDCEDRRLVTSDKRFLRDWSSLEGDVDDFCELYKRPEKKRGRPAKADVEKAVKTLVRLWYTVTGTWPTKTVSDGSSSPHILYDLLRYFLGDFSEQSFAKWVKKEQDDMVRRDADPEVRNWFFKSNNCTDY